MVEQLTLGLESRPIKEITHEIDFNKSGNRTNSRLQ